MLIGTTYSHHEIDYLKLDQKQSFTEVLDFGFDIIRLGAYWSEMEPSQGQFDLQPLASMLELCQQRHQQVLLTIGMKAPRWPEFYIPKWTNAQHPDQATSPVLNFIEQVVTAFQQFDCIQAWQVENEPFDPSGPRHWIISSHILEWEVDTVRRLDPVRPIHLTAWGNQLHQRQTLPQLLSLADSVGLDLYFKVPATRWWYSGPDTSDKQLRGLIAKSDKPVWITELQAEPWEHGRRPGWLARRSMSPHQLVKNYHRAARLNPHAILFWGFEYWSKQKQLGHPEMWQAAKEQVEIHHKA